MPSTARPATPGLSSQPNGRKRYNTDTEFASNTVAKKQRVDRTASLSHSGCASHRDNNKRRKKRKKKLPIVSQRSPSKDDPVTRTSHRELAPPTANTSLARNAITRFSSPVLEAESSSKHTSKPPVPEMPADATMASASGVNDNATADNSTLPCSNGETNNSEPESTTTTVSLENKVEQLTQELATKTKLLSSHQALLNQVQQVITCQICLEFMHKPYALSPCGHLACYDCLVQWFNAPPPDNRPAAPTTLRKKTCPHCRAVVRNRPMEIWGFKNIVQSVSKSNLASGQPAAVSDTPENQNPNADPWADIFPKISQGGQRLRPRFGEGDAPAGGGNAGMLDMEDGGIYRCLTCMHEIWNGVCTGCGCEYPPYRHHEDEDDVDLGYLIDDEPGAEEVDVEDDPGWIGLEIGEGDDVDDSDYDGHLFPWHLWADGGLMVDSIPIYDEDEDEGDDDDDDGYAGSFIDDEDPDHPRIYELPDDEDGHDQSLDQDRESSSHSAHSEEEDGDDGQESDFAPRSFGGGRLTYSDGSEEDDDDDDDDASY